MITVVVEGMSCENCVGHVREALEEVTSVAVSLANNKAEIEGEVEDAVIRAALEEEEYVAVSIARS
jgi:copper chaperone